MCKILSCINKYKLFVYLNDLASRKLLYLPIFIQPTIFCVFLILGFTSLLLLFLVIYKNRQIHLLRLSLRLEKRDHISIKSYLCHLYILYIVNYKYMQDFSCGKRKKNYNIFYDCIFTRCIQKLIISTI